MHRAACTGLDNYSPGYLWCTYSLSLRRLDCQVPTHLPLDRAQTLSPRGRGCGLRYPGHIPVRVFLKSARWDIMLHIETRGDKFGRGRGTDRSCVLTQNYRSVKITSYTDMIYRDMIIEREGSSAVRDSMDGTMDRAVGLESAVGGKAPGDNIASNRAVVSVVGKDRIGIIARVAGILAANDVNILDISQTIMQEFFTMIMLVDLGEERSKFARIQEELAAAGKEMGLKISIQHEDVFNFMHRI